MKLKTIKAAGEIKLKDVHVELEIVDKVIRSITLTDVGGTFLKITHGESYSNNIKVLIAEQPEVETKFKVTGTLHAGSDSEIPFRKVLDDEHRANNLAQDLRYKGAEDAKVEPVEVRKPADDIVDNHDDIPF